LGTGISNETVVETALGELFQNTPNPFKEKTVIRYTLPSEAKTGEIFLFDIQGNLLKKLPAGTSGYVEIQGADLRPGMYLYTLVVNGREVGTKRMILTK
jgi:hypothetical protein